MQTLLEENCERCIRQGRIQDFHLGGGAQKINVRAHHDREDRIPLRQGSMARLRALELRSSWFFMLSRAI